MNKMREKEKITWLFSNLWNIEITIHFTYVIVIIIINDIEVPQDKHKQNHIYLQGRQLLPKARNETIMKYAN